MTKMHAAVYEPNYILLDNLDRYNISKSNIARRRNVTAAAVTKAFKNRRLTLGLIGTIAEMGGFSLGSFQVIDGCIADHVSQVIDYTRPVYRLYFLIQDLVNVYGSLKQLSISSGIKENVLRRMKERRSDPVNGLVTPDDVLDCVQFDDYLTLINLLPLPYQWRYIEDENGFFPMPEKLKGTMVPAVVHQNSIKDLNEKLNDKTVLAETMTRKYNEEQSRSNEIADDNQKLQKELEKSEKKISSAKQLASARNLDINSIKQQFFAEQEYILTMLQQMIENGSEPYLTVQFIKNRIEKDRKKIEDKYGN